MTSKIPASLSFADATVLPLAMFVKIPPWVPFKTPSLEVLASNNILTITSSTAAAGLYSKSHLGLPHPDLPPSTAKKAIIVWSGASSVGTVTIQLAKASGVTVITTASSHNIQKVKSQLGADFAFDYKSSTVVNDIVSTVDHLKKDGIEFVGIYDAASLPDSFKAIGQIFDKLGSSNLVSTKKLATVLPPAHLPSDVDAKGVFAAVLDKDVADSVWGTYVPQALEKKVLQPLPPATVIGKGLESIQKGMDENKKGVSFAKVVIEL